MRCFRKEDRQPAPAALRQYFVDVLLNHPWYDPELSPLVLERHGEIAGFIGRMARPMMFQGRQIRCAIATQLMVDPRLKLGFAAIELVRAVQHGPQDLCFSDGANENSVRVWERCGGRASRLLSFEWYRVLRPSQYFALRLEGHQGTSILGRLANPLAGWFDSARVTAAPRLYRKPRSVLSRKPASPDEILAVMSEAIGELPLTPVYSPQSFSWILNKAAEAESFGQMRSIIVAEKDGRPVGWFIYFAQPRGVARVLQVGAVCRHGRGVLNELFRDAWEQKAAVVTGQIEPSLLSELSDSYSDFRCKTLGVLIHASDPSLLAAVERGDCFVSRLEGEWWMRFGIDRKRW